MIFCLAGAKPRAENKLPKSAIPYDGLDTDQLNALVGSRFDVVPVTGKPFENAELVQLTPGKQPGALKSISFNPDGGGNKRTLQAKALRRLVADARLYDVVPARGQKNAFLLVDTTSRNALVSAKLKSLNRKLWPTLSSEERETVIQENKDLLKKVNDAIPGDRFKMAETKHFLFYSDLPVTVVTQIESTLEKSYSTIGQKLGVPDDENIFRGKTMVALFSNTEDLASYGKREMGREELRGAELILAQPKGDNQLAAHIGDDPDETVANMVRCSTYAYLDHYRSNLTPPRWIHEGIAQWVMASAPPGNKELQSQLQSAAEALRKSPTLVDFFDAELFSTRWEPGVAMSLIGILIKTDPAAFPGFILQIKEGVPWREALQYNYGLTPDDVTQQFGRQIGVPDLQS
ncbi:MAG TPA: hypothetical protein VHY91_01220 [Pirellulales bacterium]|nr:hypothetical protein [Pirellulales bacterium]